MSIAKRVKLAQTSQHGVVKFLCPVNGCQYAENGSKQFTSYKLLKQVYILLQFNSNKVHAVCVCICKYIK